MTVLYWIRNNKIWKQYIQHRVEEIRQLTCRESWRYLPGAINPADLPFRGVDVEEQSLWWKGPPFLQSVDSQWPTNPVQEMNDAELAKTQPLITLPLVSAVAKGNSQLNIDEIIDINRYSNLNHLLRVTTYVVRFIDLCQSQSNPLPTFAVTTAEMSEAEMLWIKSIQHKSFDIEIHYLKKGTSSPPLRVEQFGLFLDDNII